MHARGGWALGIILSLGLWVGMPLCLLLWAPWEHWMAVVLQGVSQESGVCQPKLPPRACTCVCVCVPLISESVLRCHSREAHGKQHDDDWVRTGLEGNIPVTVCYRCAAYCCIVLLVPLCCVYCATGPLVQRSTAPRS